MRRGKASAVWPSRTCRRAALLGERVIEAASTSSSSGREAGPDKAMQAVFIVSAFVLLKDKVAANLVVLHLNWL